MLAWVPSNAPHNVNVLPLLQTVHNGYRRRRLLLLAHLTHLEQELTFKCNTLGWGTIYTVYSCNMFKQRLCRRSVSCIKVFLLNIVKYNGISIMQNHKSEFRYKPQLQSRISLRTISLGFFFQFSLRAFSFSFFPSKNYFNYYSD